MFSWNSRVRGAALVLVFGGSWMLTIGVSVVREQEGVVPQGGTVSAEAGGVGPAEASAMNVAVADVLLDQGQAHEAWDIYKETVRVAHEQNIAVSAASAADVLEGEPWSVAELLRADFSPEEGEKATQALLARGNAFLNLGRYDEAVEIFERVFILDGLNAQASKGIDRARKTLIKERRAEQKEHIRQARDENKIKAEQEWARAREAIEKDATLRARMHAERVLLIDPDHKEAQKLLDRFAEE